jgi:hypothetical protein
MAQPLLDRNSDERLKFHNLAPTYLASDKTQGTEANNLDECNRLFEV